MGMTWQDQYSALLSEALKMKEAFANTSEIVEKNFERALAEKQAHIDRLTGEIDQLKSYGSFHNMTPAIVTNQEKLIRELIYLLTNSVYDSSVVMDLADYHSRKVKALELAKSYGIISTYEKRV